MQLTRRHFKTSEVIVTVIALIIAFITLYPYLFTIIASLRKGIDIYSANFKLSDLSTAAYNRIFFGTTADESIFLISWLRNTLFISVMNTSLILLTSSLGGYALARMDFPLKNMWFSLILMVMMIPVQIIMIPKYIMITQIFKWSNTYTGAIIPFLFSPYYTFMMRQFLLSFPKDLEEAAIIDGMNRISVFTRIVLPLSKAPLLSAGILIFMGTWGSYLWPKLLISQAPRYLLSQGMTMLMGNKYINAPAVKMASAVVCTMPLLLLFIMLQKYFMASITNSGIKG